MVTSEHETGGLVFTFGPKDLTSTAGNNQVAGTVADPKKLGIITISLEKAAQILGRNPTGDDVDKLMQEYFPGLTLAPEYKEAIVKRQPISRTLFLGPAATTLAMTVANNMQI